MTNGREHLALRKGGLLGEEARCGRTYSNDHDSHDSENQAANDGAQCARGPSERQAHGLGWDPSELSLPEGLSDACVYDFH